jgi:acetyltransferase-like isoleucine patch superfamily enzyme
MTKERTLNGDWYPGTIPKNVIIDDTAYCETTFSFYYYRSRLPGGVEYGKGASTYLGTMFDVGPCGHVKLGNFALVTGARIICDAEIMIGDFALISWNVVLMDTYRAPFDIISRRKELRLVARRSPRLTKANAAKPIDIKSNVWIGFDSCVLPGVTIGEGAIVGAKSIVAEDVPPFTIVGGNPARVIRRLGSCGVS